MENYIKFFSHVYCEEFVDQKSENVVNGEVNNNNENVEIADSANNKDDIDKVNKQKENEDNQYTGNKK